MSKEQQNLVQDLHLGVKHGEKRVVKRTYRDADGVHVVYQDGATLVKADGQEPVLTPAS